MFDSFFIFIVIAILFVILAIFAFKKATDNKPSAAQQAREAKDPFDEVTGAADFHPDHLGPGAILTYGATDYVVRGTLVVRQGPYMWYEHMLDGGNGSSWLGVEIDEGQLELVWWNSRKGSGLSPRSTVEFEGVTYREQERGHAHFTSRGTTGLPERGEMRYVDYCDSSGKYRLGFEGWTNDQSWEISTGVTVLPGEFTVYPAP